MNDLQQLTISMQRLEKSQDVDINVNIPVTGDALSDCIKLNTLLAEETDTPITFNENRLIFPHITLKMGTLKGGRFQDVVKKVGDYASNIEAMELSPLPVILKQPANKYYFCEIDDSRLLSISNDLNELLCNDMNEPRFPLSKDNLHHVTLGCKNPDDNESDIIGKTISPFWADKIQISVLGRFGVCVGVLKSFQLKKR